MKGKDERGVGVGVEGKATIEKDGRERRARKRREGERVKGEK